MALLTRRRWLEEGLALLEEAGAEALTIESLTSRLEVTKGSFYHHFTDYRTFKKVCSRFGKRKEHFTSSNWQNRRLPQQKNWTGCCKRAYNPPGSTLLCVPGHGKTRGFAFTSNGSTSCGSRISKRRHMPIRLIVFLPGSSQECFTVSTLAANTSSRPSRVKT